MQEGLFKMLRKIYKIKTYVSENNFILVCGQAPVMLNGINLSNTVIKAYRINITAISLKESITS